MVCLCNFFSSKVSFIVAYFWPMILQFIKSGANLYMLICLPTCWLAFLDWGIINGHTILCILDPFKDT